MAPRSPRQRLTGVLLTLLLGLVVAPALAAVTDTPAADTPEADTPEADAPATCEPPLAVLAPSGSTGDLTAVAVTAQVLEQGVDGWAEVTWEAFPGTELTSLTIVRSDGAEVLTDPPAAGSASEVLELIACGTTGSGA